MFQSVDLKTISFLSLSTLMIACAGDTPEQSETAYAAFTISESSISTQSRYPATIRGRVDVQIYPQVSGKITELCITEGQQVKKGQTLFILDQKPYIAALNTAQADLDAAVANVASSELTLDGKQKLFDKGIISDLELQRGVNDRNAAVAARDQAAAQLDNARNNLSYTIITAPTDGVVGTLPYRVGTLVGPDAEQPLTTSHPSPKTTTTKTPTSSTSHNPPSPTSAPQHAK